VASLETRPIFVVGFTRSGTTLLQALLGAHPRIAAPPEMHYLTRIADQADFYGDLHDDERLRRALHDAIHPPFPTFADCGFDKDRIFARAARGPRTYAALLDAVLSDFAERRGKQRWAEKTPEQRVGAIRAHFPHCQVLHIVRDPRAAIASALRTRYEARGASTLARDWRNFEVASRATAVRHDPTQYHRIRYEDLVADTEQVVRRLCVFLGEDYDSVMLSPDSRRTASASTVMGTWQAGALEPITTERRDAWRGELSWTQVARIEAVVGELLPAEGYPGARRGRRQLGRLLTAMDRTGREREERRRQTVGPDATAEERHADMVRRFEEMAQRAWG
jgi:hypothetical protein